MQLKFLTVFAEKKKMSGQVVFTIYFEKEYSRIYYTKIKWSPHQTGSTPYWSSSLCRLDLCKYSAFKIWGVSVWLSLCHYIGLCV